ncbi:hypothetical protein KAR91_19445 [Candidatus Pacearchaeota archaeon]|nr:hypothetical protein [Candidatus Pacearchaeota archaeon]
MKSISSLTVRWLLISCLVLVGVFATSQAIKAGTTGTDPEFTISDLIISPIEVNTGQDVTISATIKESANNSGNYEAILKINGAVEERKTVLVEPNGSEQVSFTLSKNVAGTYSVDLNGLKGTFTAIGEPVDESSGSTFPTAPVVGGIVAAVVIVGLLIFYLNKRKAA